MKLERRASLVQDLFTLTEKGKQEGFYLHTFIYDENQAIQLQTLQIKKDAQPGTGKRVLKELNDIADRYNAIITVQPGKLNGDTEWKGTTSLSRLQKFYKSQGYQSNYLKRDYRPDLRGTWHRKPNRKAGRSDMYGWITPTGKYYPNHGASHTKTLMQLGIRMFDAFAAGWQRVSYINSTVYANNHMHAPTQKQIKELTDRCIENGFTELVYDNDARERVLWRKEE